MDLSQDGKNANNVNGMASATANPSIPIAGARIEPLPDTSTSKVPMMGPVQENETSTRVNAIKRILRIPAVESAFASIFVDQEAGSVISNAPKNEIANTTSRAKNSKLNTALVERLLSALAPKISVMRMPSRTYIKIIARP